MLLQDTYKNTQIGVARASYLSLVSGGGSERREHLSHCNWMLAVVLLLYVLYRSWSQLKNRLQSVHTSCSSHRYLPCFSTRTSVVSISHVRISTADASARRAYFQWVMQQSAENTTFTAKVQFTYKPCFTRTGVTRIHNEYAWLDENVLEIRSHLQKRQFFINERARILSDCLKGPHILEERISDSDYLNFLPIYLSGLFRDTCLSFDTRLHTCFRQRD